MASALMAPIRQATAQAFSASPVKAVAFGLLLAYVLAAPIPWGAVQPDATGTAKITIGAFVIAALAALAPDCRLRLGATGIAVAAIVAIGALGAVQLLPLPAGLVRALSPLSAEAWEGARAVLGAYGVHGPPVRITLVPRETVLVSLLTLSYAALFVAAATLLDTKARRRLFGVAVIAAGLAQVVWSISTPSRLSRVSGSLVNPNNFAGYLEIPLALSFALIWLLTRREVRGFAAATSPDERLVALEGLIPRVAASIVLWGVFAVAIGLSQSRGGILATVGGTGLLLLVAVRHRREGAGGTPRLAGALAAAIGMGTAFVVASTGTRPLRRFFFPDQIDLAEDFRPLIWRASWDAFRQFPGLGSGLGTFREAFRRVQPPEVTGLVEQAHNEYLQILVTGGAIGALLAALAAVSGLWALLRAFYRQPHREESAFTLAGLGALATLMIHGSAEFNFSIPAIPATLATVLGCAWAAGAWRSADEPEAERLTSVRSRDSRPRRRHRLDPGLVRHQHPSREGTEPQAPPPLET